MANTITTTDKAYAIAHLIRVHGIDKHPNVDEHDNITYSLFTGHKEVVTFVNHRKERKYVPQFVQKTITYDQVLGIYHDLFGE